VTAEERGSLLDGLVAVVLRAYGEYAGLFDEMWYWSPADAVRTEVDFLLRKGDRYLAIEVKSSPRFDNDTLRGLRAIRPLPGLRRLLLVYTGSASLRTEDGIDVLPLGKFFDAVSGGALF
jgi:predicted AAA+ superfamily ATPase